MKNILDQLTDELQSHGELSTKTSIENFFKENIDCYGVKMPVVHKISGAYVKQLKSESKENIFFICEELFKSGNLEQCITACDFSYSKHKSFKPGDFKLFESWVSQYVNNWATCDTFCNHSVGKLIEMYPEYLTELKNWCKSENRWMRRASAVSLIVPAKKGYFLREILEIATILLRDKDDMVQKGYGWLLKVTSQKHLTAIFEFINKNKLEMPRTALRYAVEKFPAELKTIVMKRERQFLNSNI